MTPHVVKAAMENKAAAHKQLIAVLRNHEATEFENNAAKINFKAAKATEQNIVRTHNVLKESETHAQLDELIIYKNPSQIF